MDSIILYLTQGVMLTNKKEARILMYQEPNYMLIKDILYKQGLNLPLLRYLQLKEGKKPLQELHAREYRNHIKSHAMFIRALWL